MEGAWLYHAVMFAVLLGSMNDTDLFICKNPLNFSRSLPCVLQLYGDEENCSFHHPHTFEKLVAWLSLNVAFSARFNLIFVCIHMSSCKEMGLGQCGLVFHVAYFCSWLW